jgi:hypothetical protein
LREDHPSQHDPVDGTYAINHPLPIGVFVEDGTSRRSVGLIGGRGLPTATCGLPKGDIQNAIHLIT